MLEGGRPVSGTNEFLLWLREQENAAYVWGAQGHVVREGKVFLNGKQIASDWREWVRRRETSGENAARAIRFIEGRLLSGAANEVACFDCSGLVMRYLQGVKGYLKSDLTAQGLFSLCDKLKRDALAAGDLVFRHNGKRIVHVGVYVGSGEVTEARGRDDGVVRRALGEESEWNRFGRLPMLATENQAHEDAPGEANAAKDEAASGATSNNAAFGVCAGGSVYVRTGPGTKHRALAVAHRGDRLLALPAQNGWSRAAVYVKGELALGYISAKYIEYNKNGGMMP